MLMGSDKLKLEIRSRISHLDSLHEWQIAGVKYPGMISRAFDTCVEMHAGQLLVVGGMAEKKVVAKTPTETASTCQDCDVSKLSDSEDGSRYEEQEIEYLVVVRPEIIESIRTDSSAIDDRGVLTEGESTKLTWRPVRVTEASNALADLFEEKETSNDAELTGYFTLDAAPESTMATSADCCDLQPCRCSSLSNSTNLLRPFSGATEIHFEPSPMPEPYEIDPATFKVENSWSGPMIFGGVEVGR
jgi:hypothetical protein